MPTSCSCVILEVDAIVTVGQVVLLHVVDGLGRALEDQLTYFMLDHQVHADVLFLVVGPGSPAPLGRRYLVALEVDTTLLGGAVHVGRGGVQLTIDYPTV